MLEIMWTWAMHCPSARRDGGSDSGADVLLFVVTDPPHRWYSIRHRHRVMLATN